MFSRIISVAILFLFTALLLTACNSDKKETSKADSVEPDLPSLQAKLDERAAGFEKRASEEIKKLFSDGIDSVAHSGAMETACNVADTAPDFTLPNASGEQIQLASLVKKGPVILTWYRGGW